MLQSIHDKLKGWFAYVVLGAVASTFVLWGINWTLGAPTYAAKVNGHEIPITEVRETYQRQLAQTQRGGQIQLSDAQRASLKQRVLDEYVSTEALITHSEELGYRVSEAQIKKAYAQIPAFQVAGKYDAAHAVAVLRAQGRSVAEVEGLVRRQVQLEQLEAGMRDSGFATATETRQMQAVTRQQRELGWVTVPAAHFAEGATPTDADLKTYFDAHKGEYLTPELVNLRYVELSLANIEAKVSVTEAQLKAYYEEQKAKNPDAYVQPEQRRVRHILLSVTDPKDDAAVKAKAEAILKRVQSGEDFAKLAKEFSQDPGSAQQGGDLGFSERKVWVAPFAAAAFTMQVGEIKGPVQTQFGYHILKLDDIRPATVKTFEQSRADLEAEYRRSEAEKQFSALQDQVADAALQSATDIDVLARKAGLVVQEVQNFSRVDGGGALGKSPKLIEAAFSPDVIDGHLSPVVEIEKGRGVVLRATDHRTPQQKPFEAVRAELTVAWKKARGIELAAAAAADAVKRLGAGEALDAIAKSVGGTAQAPHFVSRSDAAAPAELLRPAFEAPKPAGKPVIEAVKLGNGDSAVFALSAVREEPEGAPEMQAMLRRQVAQRIVAVESESYAAATRAAAKVAVNPQALD